MSGKLAVGLVLFGVAGGAVAQPPNARIGEAVPRDVRELYDKGLQFLAKTQTENGDWRDGNQGPGVTGMALMVLAYAMLWARGESLGWLIAGVVLLDLGAQAAHIANQARIYALRPEVRNRLNTAYMVCFFAGGATGSGLGAYGWGLWGWPGACGAGVLLLALGLAGFVATARRAA